MNSYCALRSLPHFSFPCGRTENGNHTAQDITAGMPLLQEALLLCNLRGHSVLVDLTVLSTMTSQERKQDRHLLDLKAILTDENSLRIVENVEDLINFGNRIHVPLKEEFYVDLRSWHPTLASEYCPTIRLSFPREM